MMYAAIESLRHKKEKSTDFIIHQIKTILAKIELADEETREIFRAAVWREYQIESSEPLWVIKRIRNLPEFFSIIN